MSHFNTLKSKITDAEILKASLRDLGINVQTNAAVRGIGHQRVPADIVAVLDGNCDIGWLHQADGSFSLVADLWGVSKNHNMTELLSAINQKYAVNKTLAEVQRSNLQHANVKLTVQR